MTRLLITVSLIPFSVFSLFHSLTYTRTHILPVLFPSSQSPFAFSRKLSQWIGSFVSSSQAKALEYVAYFEVFVLMPYLILTVFTSTSFVSIIIYTNFLRFRYFFSVNTKSAFSKLREYFDTYIGENTMLPTAVGSVYKKLRDFIIEFGNVEKASDPSQRQ